MSAGAKVVSLVGRQVTRAEIRREQTLISIGNSLHALRMLAEHKIPTESFRAAARSLDAFAERLEVEAQRAHTLADEYRELALAELDEGSE